VRLLIAGNREMHGQMAQLGEIQVIAASVSASILHDGSVKPANALEILALPEVDGALTGGARLEATDFEDIIGAVSAMAEPSLA
jgi:triosephosphate isomerase (TIM)